MARTAERSGLSPEQYLVWEREQPGRHEYHRGEVFATAGGSPRHNALSSNVNAILHGGYRGSGCVVLSSDQRLGSKEGERYVYADASVICGALMLQAATSDVVVNPKVVVEVLSVSTETYDRGLKWEVYQRIASLTDYLLVSQTEPRIEHFQRATDGSWVYRAAGPGGRVTLADGVEIAVDAVYEGAFELVGD